MVGEEFGGTFKSYMSVRLIAAWHERADHMATRAVANFSRPASGARCFCFCPPLCFLVWGQQWGRQWW
jgi:hypothetical protein